MQLWRNDKLAVGLDAGQAAVKAVAVIRRNGAPPEVTGLRCLDTRTEGILDPSELHRHLPGWLGEAGWRKLEITAGLPVHMTQTRVADFPPADGAALEEMIAYETQQLAGLSEERFVQDHARLPARPNHPNSVLIATCRESLVSARGASLAEAGLKIAGFGVNGIAMANAWISLYPEEAGKAGGPVLLVDVGASGGTLAVLRNGHVEHLAGLMVGIERYVQTLARQTGCPEAEAEKRLLAGRLDDSRGEAALTQVSRALEGELRTELEHWRNQERPGIAETAPVKIALCGGGARVPGLAPILAVAFDCPVEEVGVPVPGDGTAGAPVVRDPRFMTAYGLALQGVDAAPYPLSLATPALRAEARRRRNFPVLLAAAVLFWFALGLILAWMTQRCLVERQYLAGRLNELHSCADLIPRLDDAVDQIESREMMLMPVVSKANRVGRFLRTVEALTQAKGPDDWFVYVADADSYRENMNRPENRAGAARAAAVPVRDTPSSPFLPVPPPSVPAAGDIGPTSLAPEFSLRILATEVKPLRTMIVAGYTPAGAQAYKQIKELAAKINRTPLFEAADALAESERIEREDIFLPWQEMFRNRPEHWKAFSLRLPFKTQDTHLATDVKEGGKKP